MTLVAGAAVAGWSKPIKKQAAHKKAIAACTDPFLFLQFSLKPSAQY
jgi:hypothetical protein